MLCCIHIQIRHKFPKRQSIACNNGVLWLLCSHSSRLCMTSIQHQHAAQPLLLTSLVLGVKVHFLVAAQGVR